MLIFFRTNGEDLRLMLWDTAGQEEFDAITKAYYRGAQACVIAFSTTDKSSFYAVRKWKRKVEDECGHIPMVLVQNKMDLLHDSQVDNNEIEKFSRNTGIRLFRISVKDNLNVNKVFQNLAERHIEAVSRWSDECEQSSKHIGQEIQNVRDVKVRFSSSTENLQSIGNVKDEANHLFLESNFSPAQHWYFPPHAKSHHSGCYIFPLNGGKTHVGAEASSRKCNVFARKNHRAKIFEEREDKTIILSNPFRETRPQRQVHGFCSDALQHQPTAASQRGYISAKQYFPAKLPCAII